MKDIPEQMRNNILRVFLWVGLFAVAMGYLESSVVVYLRALYYPEGFSFPLKLMGREIMITEIFREAATMVMLVCIALVAAKKPVVRFAFFIYAFAIWDIFYYLFLFLLIGWPSSLLEWDILFLIPVTWAGPVLAPVINSLTMILLACVIAYADHRSGKPALVMREWVLILAGSAITVAAYTMDYLHYLATVPPLSGGRLPVEYVPQSFNWWLFLFAEVLFLLALFLYLRRICKPVT